MPPEHRDPGVPSSSRSAAPPRERARPGWPWATTLLTVAFVGVFAGVWNVCRLQAEPGFVVRSLYELDGCRAVGRLGGLVATRVWLDQEWWRVLSAPFTHGSVLHLTLNAWSLWVIGPWVERAWSGRWMLALFLLGGVLGGLASLAWAEAVVVVGASGGVMALAGALWVARLFGTPDLRGRLDSISAARLGLALVALIGIGAFVPVVAQAGHVGGLLGGLALGFARSSGRRPLRLAGALAFAALLLGGILAGARPEHRSAFHVFVGFERFERGDLAGAVDSLARALDRDPDDDRLANAVAYALAEQGVALERAERLVRGALEAEPANADYLDTLGWILCQQGRTAEGLAVLQKASAATAKNIAEIERHLERCALAGPAVGR